jgi:uncharacterized membrane protein YfcA
MHDYLLPTMLLWGLLAGFLGGVLGIGGGLIFVLVIPAGLRHLGLPESEMVQLTVANSLACTFFTSLAAGIRRFAGNAQIRNATLMVGISSTLVSLLLLRFLVNPGYLTPQGFRYFFIAILCYMILRMIFKLKEKESGPDSVPDFSKKSLLLTGLFSGIVSPLSGLGGGIVVVPLLHTLLRFPVAVAQAISFGVIALSTMFSTLLNLTVHPASSHIPSTGLIVWPLFLSLAPAAAAGALAGTKLASRMKPVWLSGLLLVFLTGILIRTLFFTGS